MVTVSCKAVGLFRGKNGCALGFSNFCGDVAVCGLMEAAACVCVRVVNLRVCVVIFGVSRQFAVTGNW